MNIHFAPTKLKIFSGAIKENVEDQFNGWSEGKCINNFQFCWQRGNFYLAVLYTDTPVVDFGGIQPYYEQTGPFGPVGPCPLKIEDPVPNPYEITCQTDKDPTNGEFIFH